MQGSVWYNLVFAATICVVCAVFVSGSFVALRDRHLANELLEKQRNVLLAAGLASEDESLSREEVERRSEPVRQVVIDLQSGEALEIDSAVFNQRSATTDPETSREAPSNQAGVPRMPDHALVYELRDGGGDLDLVVLPVSGLGLWGTLYGFIALDADLETVRGLTFYEHKETPGLGGEVDNPRWKSLWNGRRAIDGDTVRIEVVKGQAGDPDNDPYRVDGLVGATITSRGVSRLVRFWLGEHGFRPYFDRLRDEGTSR